MSLLQAYCDYVKAGDVKKVASLFTEDAYFLDEAPVKLGLDPIEANGKKAIEEMFEGLLAGGGLTIENIGINGNAMRYDVNLGGMSVLALGVMKEENNLIKEYRVTAV